MIIKTDKPDEQGKEFDYYDEYPKDDPFMPKPTCPDCDGLGTISYGVDLLDSFSYTCSRCRGTGAI